MSYSEAEFNAQCDYLRGLVQEQRERAEKAEARLLGVAQGSPEPDLVQRCKELLEWSNTGLLNGGKGGAVRALADRLRSKIGDHYALNVAENQTKDEAMREVVRLAAQPPAAPVETCECLMCIAEEEAANEIERLSHSSAETGEATTGPASSGTSTPVQPPRE